MTGKFVQRNQQTNITHGSLEDRANFNRDDAYLNQYPTQVNPLMQGANQTQAVPHQAILT